MVDSREPIPPEEVSRFSAEALARHCQAAAFLVDARGAILSAGPGYALWTGAPHPPPSGMDLRDTVHRHDRAAFDPFLTHALSLTVESTSLPCRPASPGQAPQGPATDEVERVFEAVVTPISEGGLSGNFHCLFRDVSWRVAAEELSRSLQRDLAHVLRLLTTGTLVTEATHDLMQPLSGIVSFVDGALFNLERESVPVEEARGWLETIRQQAEVAAGGVRRLREFARRAPRPKEPVSMAGIVEEAAATVAAQARARRVQFEIVPETGTAEILGRAIELRQVFVNLFLNSIEAERSAEAVSITRGGVVRFESRCEAGVWRGRVIDDGLGLAEEARRSLFEPFITTRPRGLGLGLSICRAILDGHGGSIRHIPTATGTEFEVTLPARPTTSEGAP